MRGIVFGDDMYWGWMCLTEGHVYGRPCLKGGGRVFQEDISLGMTYYVRTTGFLQSLSSIVELQRWHS